MEGNEVVKRLFSNLELPSLMAVKQNKLVTIQSFHQNIGWYAQPLTLLVLMLLVIVILVLMLLVIVLLVLMLLVIVLLVHMG